MKVEKINSVNSWQSADQRKKVVVEHCPIESSAKISFKRGTPNSASNFVKKFRLGLRLLGKSMNEITEITNASIAAIGTGIIAPAVILVSPGKGDKDDKDKKKLQALRQPISALLQLGFQVPTTIVINRYIDSLGYEKKIKLFKDDVIGDLIPTEKYISKDIKKEEIEALEAKFEEIIDGSSLRKELEAEIKYDYEQVGLEISDKKLAKDVEKKKKGFLRKKVAQEKLEKLKAEKLQEILNNPEKYPKLANIKEIDLVTERYQGLAEERFKTQFNQIEKDANLSFFDRTMRLLGFGTKKTRALEKSQKEFRKNKGLELLKQESPEIFTDKAKKIKTYIESYEKEAQKIFGNKKFGISLAVNLVMIAMSCYALNWLHPKVNKFFENRKAEKEANKNPKVEVG